MAKANGKSNKTVPKDAECGVSCHLAVDSATHEVICADLPLSGTTDAQALLGLIK